MPSPASILFGAAVTLFSAYALGAFAMRKLAAPAEIALAVGAAILSVLIFCTVLAGLAGWPSFLVLAAGAGLATCKARSRCPPLPLHLGLLILAPFAVWYFVNALAPETLPDGIGYHLGLPYQYIRTGGFPTRIQFFDAVPQGMEMLYTMAFSFGRHSAARLVEFGFLLATVPLMLRIGRKLGMSDAGSLVAVVFYFCAPVAGITGASSYTDAATVFFALAVFYSLLEWRETGSNGWLAAAGLGAGFCYAIKITGAIVLLGAFAFVAGGMIRGGPKRVPARWWAPFGALAASAAVIVAPWVLRDWIATGNPAAPLGNAFFPNPYFHLLTERELGAALASYGHVPLLRLPWELAFGDRLTGTFGPLLWLLPLGLVGLRSRAARLCLAAALIVALPWWSNRGARFLMPAVALAAFPMAMVLPRRLAWAAIVVQAIACWPQALNAWQPDWIFRLHEFPLRAALRIEPEAEYISRHSPEYRVARMVESATPPGARIFSFDAVANAYLARNVTVSWQSAEGDRISDTLRLAAEYRDATYAWTGAWQPVLARGLRFRLPRAYPAEWDITDVEIASDVERIAPSARWTLRAWPNLWETPLALDGNQATRWRTWEPMRSGMFFEIDFDQPQRVARVAVWSHTPVFNVPLEMYGRFPDGRWNLLSAAPAVTRRPDEDLRLQATAALRRAGFQFLMVPDSAQGLGEIGRGIESDPLAWDLETAGKQGDEALFRIR